MWAAPYAATYSHARWFLTLAFASAGTLPEDWGDGGFVSANAFWLQRNELSGTVPASWAALNSLERLVLRPGNPELCGPVPSGLPFYICTDADASCLKERPTLLEGSCAPAASPAGEPAGTGASMPQAGQSGSEDGVPVAAIAVPVAVGVPLLAAGFLAWAAVRRRQQLRRDAAAAQQAAQHRVQLGVRIVEFTLLMMHPLCPRQSQGQQAALISMSAHEHSCSVQAHPFDTEEGRAALTSPFAVGAFQTLPPQFGAAAGHFHAPSSQPAVRQGSRSPSRQRGPRDSVGTQSSSLSAGSYRSYLAAKCTRIETRSLPVPLGSNTDSTDRLDFTAPPRGAAEPAGPPEQAAEASIELQPVPLLSRSEAEERDFVGSMLLGTRVSSEQVGCAMVSSPHVDGQRMLQHMCFHTADFSRGHCCLWRAALQRLGDKPLW